MAPRAFVVGGTGQIGRAVALRLANAGWDVTIAARTRDRLTADLEDAVKFVTLDRSEGLAIDGDFEALVDVIPYSDADAQQLLALAGRVGTIAAISSCSVYMDDAGRTLDEATSVATLPRYPIPVRETQSTVPPGPQTYSTGKAAVEKVLLEQDFVPATVVRPVAVYGPWGEFTREQHFVRRALDGRSFVVLPHRGANIFHPTSVENIAELVRLSVELPGTRVFNCGDPDPPTILEISRAVAAAVGHSWTECLLPGDAVDGVGRTPWGRTFAPLVVDMTEAEREVGYRPAVTYEEAVVATCRWVVDEQPALGDYMETFFDYEAEDAFLETLRS